MELTIENMILSILMATFQGNIAENNDQSMVINYMRYDHPSHSFANTLWFIIIYDGNYIRYPNENYPH